MAIDEKLSHKNALCEVQHLFRNVRADVLVLHGKADKLIYYSNTEYYKTVFGCVSNFCLITTGGGHYTFLKENKRLFNDQLKLFLSK